jgi:hypothetical protein
MPPRGVAAGFKIDLDRCRRQAAGTLASHWVSGGLGRAEEGTACHVREF